MIARFTQWQGRKPESIAADASYGNGQFLQWLTDREIKPYMPTRDAVGRTKSLLYGPGPLPTYRRATVTSPCSQQLNYGGRNEGNRTFGYIGTRKKCGPWEQNQCTTRTVPVSCNPHERSSSAASARPPNYTGVRTGTATAKEGRGALRRTKESQSHRPQSAPAPQVDSYEQFFLAATAQNIKRLVRFLSRPTMSPVPVTS